MRRLGILIFLPLILLPGRVEAQTSDTTPPTLTSLDFNPKAIDVRVSPQDIGLL